ncbi:hypothetical protein ACLB1T_25915 [Escherichia coli]
MTICTPPCAGCCWVRIRCGLTRGQDAKAAYDAGAIYGGLIFVATSPRCVNVEQAQEVMAA